MSRVLLVHDRFHPDSGGGGEYVVLRRAEYLAQAGIDVEVICAGDPETPQPQGYHVQRIKTSRKTFALAAPRIIKAARTCDLMHSFPYNAALPATVAARVTGTPLVIEQLALFGSAWRVSHPGWKGKVLQRAEKMLLQLPADGRVFLSPFSKNLASLVSAGVTGEVIAPGIDPDPVLLAAHEKNGRVMFAGKFTQRKGIDRVVDVARAMPDVAFDAVGWGGGFDDFDIPPNLHVIEARGEAYKKLLAAAPILLLPSRAETFGLVIYEAMQASCSIVSTIPGDYAGEMLSEWTTEMACRAISERLASADMLQREGAENRNRVARLTWEENTRQTLELYKRINPKAFS